jgi:hypothetical protein
MPNKCKLTLSKLFNQNEKIDFLSLNNQSVSDWIEVEGSEIDENRKQNLIRIDTYDRNTYFSLRSHILQESNCLFKAKDIFGKVHTLSINII